MTPYLYRFRTLSRLLKEGELERQELFFASPDTLNDPMEGFRDLFWKGDEIIWMNLFRHYILCLDWVFSFISIAGESHPVSWVDIPYLRIDAISPTPEYTTRIERLAADFLQVEEISHLATALGARTAPVRRDELSFYLHAMHIIALHSIKKNHTDSGLAKATPPDKEFDNFLHNSKSALSQTISAMNQRKKGTLDSEKAISTIFQIYRIHRHEVEFIALQNNPSILDRKNSKFLFLDFPNEYINGIESLLYPEWYTACFMQECRNSSVWGSYGDNHTAVCLIFNVENNDGIPSLRLERAHGYGSGGKIIGFVPHQFYEITYENKHAPVDFFRSLGRLPVPDLMRTWYTNRNGAKSICAEDIEGNVSVWRNRYLDTFFHGITHKLPAWGHEKEHRLILTGFMMDFSDPSSRIVHYKFSDLHGIIFGIKTPDTAKFKICKIIEDKCRQSGRTDFKFYQAYYSQTSGEIEHREMEFLRFDFSQIDSTKS